MTNMGPGMGAQITCDEGQIRVYDPSSVSYYIEGYNAGGNLVCGHASNKGPYMVGMAPEADFLHALPGQNPPKECTPCPPWDPTCGTFGKPTEGQSCDPATGCAVGLICGDAGLCEPTDGNKEPSGPSSPGGATGTGAGGWLSLEPTVVVAAGGWGWGSQGVAAGPTATSAKPMV